MTDPATLRRWHAGLTGLAPAGSALAARRDRVALGLPPRDRFEVAMREARIAAARSTGVRQNR